jgi:hypothetical protein
LSKEELHAVSDQEAPEEDAEEETSKDAEEDALAAATARQIATAKR